MESDNLISAINEKYGGRYIEDPEKVGYTPDGVIRQQLSYSTFTFRNHTVRVVSNDDGLRWNPYKVIIHLEKVPRMPFLIVPRSFLGTLFHRFDLHHLRRKYRLRLHPDCYEGLRKNFHLEALMLVHTLEIYTSSKVESPSLILYSEDSVLDVETLETHLEIGAELAEILDACAC